MSWLFIIPLLLTSSTTLSEARPDDKKPSSAVIVGTVYCDTCFQQDFSKTSSHFIPGASVAVECKDEDSKHTFRQEAKTDEHGEFRVHLPLSVSKHVKKIKLCSVKLISSNGPYCGVTSTATTSSSLHLKSKKQGIHIFSAGFFTFKPNLCNQKPSVRNSKQLYNKKNENPPIPFPAPLRDPETPPDLPEIPLLPRLPPFPILPPLPPILGIRVGGQLSNIPLVPTNINTESKWKDDLDMDKSKPILDQKLSHPVITKTKPDRNLRESQKTSTIHTESLNLPSIPFLPTPTLPPNPLQPPSGLPPNPFFPPPVFPPNPLQPPSPLIPLPTVPGLTPPPPPTFPIPLPPLIPGIPPAASSP
ncbi:hypothetical protein ACFE04_007124 [Oxalis oulophora]